MTRDLDAAELAHALTTTHLGREARFLSSCESTNDVALTLLDQGAPHGALVVSDEQTRGRGQRGRAWHSAPGLALHVSLILLPPGPVTSTAPFVAAAGLGVAEGLEEQAGAPVGIKWPNDLWIAERKVCGILLEARGFEPGRPAMVLGIGINVNHGAEHFPAELRGSAGSLAQSAGRRFHRTLVLAAVLNALEPRLEQAAGGGVDLDGPYRARSVLLGRRVSLFDASAEVVGRVLDLGATDGLLVQTDDGRRRHVRAEHARDVRPL